jgi:hypothetical protein
MAEGMLSPCAPTTLSLPQTLFPESGLAPDAPPVDVFHDDDEDERWW